MGLDCRAIAGPLTKVDGLDRTDDSFWDCVHDDGLYVVEPESPWEGRQAPLELGAIYKPHGVGGFNFRAGSYSTYGQYREMLCELALGVSPEKVWHDPETFAGRPFVEQIEFSDCEGTLGPEVSRKLADDYERHRDRARGAWGEDSYYCEVYERFSRAFRLAADTEGAVEYA